MYQRPVHPGMIPDADSGVTMGRRGLNISHPGLAEDNPPAEDETPLPPPAETTSASEPEKKLYAGKYETPEELERGYQGFVENVIPKLQAAEQRLAQLEPMLMSAMQGRLAQQSPAVDPLQELEELGIPRDKLEAAVSQIASRVARNEISPYAETQRATTNIVRSHPDYPQVADAVTQHIQSDPTRTQKYNRMFEVDPELALDWAYLGYKAATPQKQSAADKSPSGVIQPARAPQQRGAQTSDRDREQRALEYSRQYKDPMPYVHERLKGLIPDSHFTEG